MLDSDTLWSSITLVLSSGIGLIFFIVHSFLEGTEVRSLSPPKAQIIALTVFSSVILSHFEKCTGV